MYQLPSSSLLSITGPTGSGKTAAAAALARQWLENNLSVAIISLDSRQVYQEFPVLSVADLDIWQPLQRTYGERLRVYNLSSLRLHEDWSFGVLLTSAREQISHSLKQGRQIIAVGGTCVCHERLLQTQGDFTNIPPDDNVRFAAENMSVGELQEWLKKIDTSVFNSMNPSDRANPRRLVRKIEIALAHKLHLPQHNDSALASMTQYWYLPNVEATSLRARIHQRVQQRLADPQCQREVSQVLQDWPEILTTPKLLSRVPLGFVQLARWQQKEWTQQQALTNWQNAEWHYARQQLTWSKKLRADHHTHLIDQRELLADETPISLGNIGGIN